MKYYWFLAVALLVLLVGLLLPVKITFILITGLAAFFSLLKPKQGLLLLLLYVPIRPLIVEVNPGFKLAGDAIILAVFLRLLFNTRREWKSWFHFRNYEWAFFTFLISGTIVGFLTGASAGAIVFQLRTFLIMYLLYFIVSRMGIETKDMKRFAWVTVVASFIVSIHGLIEKLSQRQLLLPDAWSQKVLSATNAVRIYGLTGNPNSLAIYLAFSIVMVLYLLYITKKEQHKYLYGFLTLFMGVFLLTYSRGTWIALSIGLVAYIVLTRHWKILKPLLVTSIFGLLLIYLPANLAVDWIEKIPVQNNENLGGKGTGGGIGNRFKETFDEKNLDSMVESGRIYYIKKGFEIFLDHPIAGTGLATFGDSATLSYGSPIYDEYGIRSDIYGGKNFYSDNQYIQVITETGVLGVILFAVFLLGMLHLFWKKRKEGFFPNFMMALWLSAAASGFYYNIWELKLFTMYYFILLGAYISSYLPAKS